MSKPRKTRLFGKNYHWLRRADGVLALFRCADYFATGRCTVCGSRKAGAA